ncbi:hypothetical protein MNV49_000474 [Pseudohyphozyma bogoriensis]|nr:hypothetical protein MNV49_000474 [Pseudohyphozyma bogoriensis]
MVGHIPGLVSVRAGMNFPSTSPKSKGYELGVLAILEKKGDLPGYAAHPKHLELLEFRKSFIEDALPFDFED